MDIEAKLTEAFKDFSDSDLHAIASDIDIEDHTHPDMHDYDRDDLISVITEFVEDGIKDGHWTIEEWIKDITGPDSAYKTNAAVDEQVALFTKKVPDYKNLFDPLRKKYGMISLSVEPGGAGGVTLVTLYDNDSRDRKSEYWQDFKKVGQEVEKKAKAAGLKKAKVSYYAEDTQQHMMLEF